MIELFDLLVFVFCIFIAGLAYFLPTYFKDKAIQKQKEMDELFWQDVFLMAVDRASSLEKNVEIANKVIEEKRKYFSK
jgi:hypothetical protein